jgi:hypothetical protein
LAFAFNNSILVQFCFVELYLQDHLFSSATEKRGLGGHRRQGERGGGGRERGCAGKTKTKNTMATMEERLTREETPPEPRTNSPIEDEMSARSTYRWHLDEALDETDAAVPLDSTDDARIECNYSWELEPSQTLASNSRSYGSRLEKGFRNSERA